MKQKVGPVAIVIGVVLVAAFCVMIYRWAFAPQSPPASRDYMPDYAKTRAVKPGDEGKADAAGGAATSTSAGPSYGQGYGQRPAGGSNMGGRPSYAGGQGNGQ